MKAKQKKKLKHLKKQSYNHSQDIDYVLLKNNSANLIMVVLLIIIMPSKITVCMIKSRSSNRINKCLFSFSSSSYYY